MPGCGLIMKMKGWMDMDGSYEFSFFPCFFYYSGSGLLHIEHPEIGPVASASSSRLLWGLHFHALLLSISARQQAISRVVEVVLF
jgi:hypothetical protein